MHTRTRTQLFADRNPPVEWKIVLRFSHIRTVKYSPETDSLRWQTNELIEQLVE